ncbi:MAG: sulfotransferase domain-containing protein [Chloroflexi bacterium]|nr:sulfotransferase domain-containing protein [Chloroflexota bacterium]
MKAYFIIKRGLKHLRWRARRGYSILRWGRAKQNATPILFGNAIPKAGSHLLIQILWGLTEIGPAVDPGFAPVNRWEDNSKLPPEATNNNIKSLKPGDIGYGYLNFKEPYISSLTGPGRATIFIYRDPRDVIVSSVFYATEIHKEHGMQPYYTHTLNSTEERINAEIVGVSVPGFEYNSTRKKYRNHVGWLNQPDVLSIKFEDLILKQDDTLRLILEYVAMKGFEIPIPIPEAIEILIKNIEPRKSGTFRKGKPGNWREHFTETNIKVFKEETGDLLIRWGYEESLDW